MKKNVFMFCALNVMLFVLCLNSCNTPPRRENTVTATRNRPVTYEDMEKARNEGKDIQISAEDFAKAFKDNKVGATAKYVGKPLIIYGEIKDIDNSLVKKTPRIELKAGFFFDIDCYFTTNSQLFELKKGERVTIKGMCTDKDTLRNCEVLQ